MAKQKSKRKRISKISKSAEKGVVVKVGNREYLKTGVKGFDQMFEHGIPKGKSVIVAGGTGSGKTIFCLQIIFNALRYGNKCLYMSFEETEESLEQHMEDFGWEHEKFKNNLLIRRFNLFDISRSIDAMFAKAKGDVEIDIRPMILPRGFKPDIIVIDSLTAIASAFIGKDRNYRTYIEQLFLFFQKSNATTFLITETEEVPKMFSPTGTEEFLADGVIVLYNIRKGNIRERGLEIVKMRGAGHSKKVVAMAIVKGTGIMIYPNRQVFKF